MTNALTHPLSTTAYAAGIVRGFAASMIRVAAGQQGPLMPGHLPGPVAAPIEENVSHDEVTQVVHLEPRKNADDATSRDDGPQRVLVEDFPPAAEQRAPAEPGEAFATEPSAVTRLSAHGGHGADAEIDDWSGDDADEGVAASSVIEALELGDQVAGETPDLKAVLSEAETLRRAARSPSENA